MENTLVEKDVEPYGNACDNLSIVTLFDKTVTFNEHNGDTVDELSTHKYSETSTTSAVDSGQCVSYVDSENVETPSSLSSLASRFRKQLIVPRQPSTFSKPLTYSNTTTSCLKDNSVTEFDSVSQFGTQLDDSGKNTEKIKKEIAKKYKKISKYSLTYVDHDHISTSKDFTKKETVRSEDNGIVINEPIKEDQYMDDELERLLMQEDDNVS